MEPCTMGNSAWRVSMPAMRCKYRSYRRALQRTVPPTRLARVLVA